MDKLDSLDDILKALEHDPHKKDQEQSDLPDYHHACFHYL